MKYLKHYGVKGMHWGEWNEETRERYGIRDDDGGLSKLKAFRETSYVLPPGTTISRFTGLDEAKKGSTLSKPYFYGSHNEHDYNQYADMATKGDLPSTQDLNFFGNKLSSKSGLVRMSSVDDVVVARGQFVVDQLLTGYKTLPTQETLTDPDVQDHFRKMGYDAIEDVHDQPIFGTGVSTHPLIVLNGGKLKTDYSGTYRRKKPPAWDDRLRHSTLPPEEVKRRRYAFPEQRKFPLNDRSHVLSAIRFFNYVSPKDERQLANAILKRMHELGMSDVNIGKANRFAKYYSKS